MGSGGKRGLFTLGLGNRELGLGNLGNPRAARGLDPGGH